MTDRDTFAAAALTGLLADPLESAKATEYVAAASYEIADAMLRERERVTEALPKEKLAEVLLTDDERAAILASEGFWALEQSPHAVTLRSLLARLA